MARRPPHVNESGANRLSLNKSFGQHLLKNPLLLKTIIEKSAILPTDTVLEIGPGTGNLTAKLLERAKKVIVCEVDMRMVDEIRKRFHQSPLYSKLQIVVGDAIATEWPFFNLCVANLPYQISSPFVFKLLSQASRFRCAVVMVQREFALRLLAKPGDKLYSRISVNVQLLAKVDHLIKVGRNSFRPPPKVDSSVIRIEPLTNVPQINFKEWDGLLRICFTRKNKTLRSIFSSKSLLEMIKKNYLIHKSLKNEMVRIETTEISKLVINCVSECGFLEKRSRTMTIDDFLKLQCAFNTNGIHFA